MQKSKAGLSCFPSAPFQRLPHPATSEVLLAFSTRIRVFGFRCGCSHARLTTQASPGPANTEHEHGQSTAKPTAKCSSNEDEAAQEDWNNTSAANIGTQLIGFKASDDRIKTTLNQGAHIYAGHKLAGHYTYASHKLPGHYMYAGHQIAGHYM